MSLNHCFFPPTFRKNFKRTAKLREFYSEAVEQLKRRGAILLPRGHLGMSEDILGCHNWRDASDI